MVRVYAARWVTEQEQRKNLQRVAKIQQEEERSREFAQQFPSQQAFQQGITRLNALQVRERQRRRESSNMPFFGSRDDVGSNSEQEGGEASQPSAKAMSS